MPPMYTRDPIWPNYHTLAANAEPMTTDLWEAMKHGYRHAPVRPEHREPSRARPHEQRIRVWVLS